MTSLIWAAWSLISTACPCGLRKLSCYNALSQRLLAESPVESEKLLLCGWDGKEALKFLPLLVVLYEAQLCFLSTPPGVVRQGMI